MIMERGVAAITRAAAVNFMNFFSEGFYVVCIKLTAGRLRYFVSGR